MTIPVSTSFGRVIFNRLDEHAGLDDLTQDMLAIAIPNGYQIDVGWFPEHDPHGQYLVRVFHRYWDNQVANPVRTRNAFEAADTAVRLAAHYSRPIVPTSASDDVTTSVGSSPSRHIFCNG